MTDEWLERIKQTLALDLSIALKQGLPPRACIEFLMRTPEFREALEYRAELGPKR